MSINFPLVLTSAVVITGVISVIDCLFLSKRRMAKIASGGAGARGLARATAASAHKVPVLIDYARSFFPVLLIVLLIRSFLAQPFYVPTGSLEPTVLPGDFVLVNQFAYGLRLPVTNTEIANTGRPTLGQLAVFHWPVDPSIDFVKRVAGLPGDHIVYKDKVLTINGKEMSQVSLGSGIDYEPGGNVDVEEKLEDLQGVKHKILLNPDMQNQEEFDRIVPPGSYFMLGDNRDNSGDSRFWGFVPEENLVGKPIRVLLSWDKENYRIRWHRIGMKLE